MRRRHSYNRVDGVGLIVSLDKHCSCDYTAHGVAKNYDRGRVWEVAVASLTLRVRVERKDVANSLVQVFGLIKQRLAMKGGDIFIEIDCKEVKTSDPAIKCCTIMLKVVMEVIGRLGRDGTDLLVATGITRDKENGNTTQLHQEVSWKDTERAIKLPDHGKVPYPPRQLLVLGRDTGNILLQIECAQCQIQ